MCDYSLSAGYLLFEMLTQMPAKSCPDQAMPPHTWHLRVSLRLLPSDGLQGCLYVVVPFRIVGPVSRGEARRPLSFVSTDYELN